MNDNLITLEGVFVKYKTEFVLRDIYFSVKPAEIVTIVGPNGGGKSTLLKTVMGILKPAAGKIIYSEKLGPKPLFGYMPQQKNQDEDFPVTAFDAAAMPLYAKKKILERLTRNEIEFVKKILSMTGVENLAEKNYGALSGGQKQRVLIARALALSPKILLLDEPSAGLDSAARDDFYLLLTRLKNETGVSIVMVSHDIGSVTSVSDRVACLAETIHYHGAPEGCFNDESMEKAFGRNVYVLKHDHGCETCRKSHE